MVSWIRSKAATCRRTSDVKLEPWSERILSGSPTLEKMGINASATVVDSILERATGSG